MNGFRPMLLTKAAMDHTALRGGSFVSRGNVYMNSAIVVEGTNRVVPRILSIGRRTRGTIPFRFPSMYPSYNGPIARSRKRTTVHYAGASYPTRLAERLVRFMDHSTVSVSKLNPTVLRRLSSRKLMGSPTSLCELGTRSVSDLRHGTRGSTRGLVSSVRGSGRGRLFELIFTLKVHGVNLGTTGVVYRGFTAVSSVVDTGTRSFRGVSNFNTIVTRDLRGCFSLSNAGRLVTSLGSLNLEVGPSRPGGANNLFRNGAFILANALPAVAEDRTSGLVRRGNKGADSSISGGASCILTNRSTNDGLAGTRALNITVVSRRRLGRVLSVG